MLFKRLGWAVLFGGVLVAGLVPGKLRAATPQASQAPLTKQQVLSLVRNQLGDEAGARAVKERGTDFVPTEDFLQALEAAGATQVFLQALRQAKHPESAAATEKGPLDAFQVVLLAVDGVSEQRIASLVKERGIYGRPNEGAINFLRKLGVTQTVIDALNAAPKHDEAEDQQAIVKHAQVAEQDLRGHLRANPRSVPLRELLAIALQMQGKDAEARDILAQVERELRGRLERSPQNASLRDDLSFVRELEGRGTVSQATAVGSLRTLNTAAITYASTYNQGFPASLSVLAPPTGTATPPSAEAAGLINETLASGTNSGYVFTYTPGEKDANGRINTYTIRADPVTPGATGQIHYFTDQSGVIRQETDKPATANSPPITG
jgi:hypothetical protein